ncbi:hypothetical protein AYK21_04990 [Thermoplasmatales archaeon SG8-52-2]|nr:MAG: hypothetical protein AYK21_04990 [Thermoplasmatales archaeon SG8-52-2]
MKNETYGFISKDIILGIGEKTKLKSGFLNTINLIYCGMISKEIFSVSILFGTGNQGFSYNLYYQKDTKSISVGSEIFSVIEVNAEKLILRKIEI